MGVVVVWQAVYGKISLLSAQFCYEPTTALKKQSLLKKKKKSKHACLVPEIAKKPLWFLSSGREGQKEGQEPSHLGKKCENVLVWSHLVFPSDLFFEKHNEMEIVDGYNDDSVNLVMNNMLHFLEKSLYNVLLYLLP